MKVTITQRKLDADRVPVRHEPVFEVELADNERVLGVAHYFSHGGGERVTEDHRLIVWIESRP